MARSNEKDPSIKEWAISRLKKGYIPKQIAIDIRKLHGVSVTMMTIYRWRKQHIEVTGEVIPSKHEFNKSLKKKNQKKESK